MGIAHLRYRNQGHRVSGSACVLTMSSDDHRDSTCVLVWGGAFRWGKDVHV